MSLFVCCLLGLLIVGGQSKNLQRITNGYTAQQGQFPYIVALDIYRPNEIDPYWCGGNIIANNWVLTAAHCTDRSQKIIIYYGSILRRVGGLKRDAIQVIQHPQYKKNEYVVVNDLAVIRTLPVKFNKLTRPIALPRLDGNSESFEGQLATAAGWGNIRTGGPSTYVLQWVDLKIISIEQCSKTYMYLTQNHLCTSTSNGQSTCPGDSGGPLVLKSENKLVGVVSFGRNNSCEDNHSIGFVRVNKYLDWIHSKTGVSY